MPPAGAHALFAKVIDSQGSSSTSSVVSIQVSPLSLAITTPVPNASIGADFVLVSGTYQAPPNSGITVNGMVARNDAQGHFFVNNVPLVPGANTIRVTLVTADGQSTTQLQSVTSSAAAPMQIYVDSDSDFAPMTCIVRVTNRTGNAIANVSYSDLAGGQVDVSGANQTTLGTIAYTDAGMHSPRFVVTDSLGNVYAQTLNLVRRKTKPQWTRCSKRYGEHSAVHSRRAILRRRRSRSVVMRKFATAPCLRKSHHRWQVRLAVGRRRKRACWAARSPNTQCADRLETANVSISSISFLIRTAYGNSI